MIGSPQPKAMAEFYEKIFGKPTMTEGEWAGWQVGSSFFSVGPHSEVSGQAKEPQRVIFNFETKEVKEEFERIKGLGATVIKEPYAMGEDGKPVEDGGVMKIATFADPDGNYFQLMTRWEG